MVYGLNTLQAGLLSNELLLSFRGGELLFVELRMEEEALTTAAFSFVRFSATYLSSC